MVLVIRAARELRRADDQVDFRTGMADTHHLQNGSERVTPILEGVTRNPEGPKAARRLWSTTSHGAAGG